MQILKIQVPRERNEEDAGAINDAVRSLVEQEDDIRYEVSLADVPALIIGAPYEATETDTLRPGSYLLSFEGRNGFSIMLVRYLSIAEEAYSVTFYINLRIDDLVEGVHMVADWEEKLEKGELLIGSFFQRLAFSKDPWDYDS